MAWGGSYGIHEHVFRCVKDSEHTGIHRPARIPISERHLPYIRTSTKRRRELEQEHGKSAMTKLAIYEQKGLLTQPEADLVVRTLWPEAPDTERTKAAMICVQYGLNPLMKHLFLIPFNRKDKDGNIVGKDWAVVMGIQATRVIASRGQPYRYADGPRIMTDDEQQTIFGKLDKSKIFAICRIRKRDGGEGVGYGTWPKGDQPKGVEKGNSQENMAMIRAERNGLDRAAPGSLPKDVDVVDEAWVDEATGEIVEGEAVEALPEGDAEPKIWPFRGKYGDIGKTCPDHLMDWELDNYKGTVSRQHRMPDDPKQFCKLKDILRPIMADQLAKHGWTEEHFNANLAKPQHGTTWSKLDELDFIALLDFLDEAEAPDDLPSPAPPSPEPEAPGLLEYDLEQERTAEAKPARDPQTLTDITALFKACNEDFGMQPADVLKELGYSSQTDISEKPAEAYLKVRAVRSPAVH